MAEVTPTPTQGSWFGLDLVANPSTPDTQSGSWFALLPIGAVQIDAPPQGSWFALDLYVFRRRIRRGLGIVHTRSR